MVSSAVQQKGPTWMPIGDWIMIRPIRDVAAEELGQEKSNIILPDTHKFQGANKPKLGVILAVGGSGGRASDGTEIPLHPALVPGAVALFLHTGSYLIELPHQDPIVFCAPSAILSVAIMPQPGESSD